VGFTAYQHNQFLTALMLCVRFAPVSMCIPCKLEYICLGLLGK